MKLTGFKFTVIIFIIASLISGGSVYLFTENYNAAVKTGLQNKASDLDSEVRLLKTEIDEKNRELSNQKDEYKSQIDKLQSDIKVLSNSNKTDQSKTISGLLSETEKLKQKIYDLQNAITILKKNDGERLKSVIAPRADEVMKALKSKDYKQLSALVHPKKGVRFSPYAYVDTKKHLLFTYTQIEKMSNDNTKYLWGNFDGSGKPIEMTFKEYIDRFVYNKEYASTDKIGYNQFLGGGNTLNNAFEVYPDAYIIDYFIPGTNPAYGGLDFGDLRLVFENEGGIWYLVGIIHNEWTI